ncbi:MAG: O-antigen ligase family protein [Vicinamibacterales bacterium]
MTSTTMSMTGTRALDLDRVTFGLLLAFVAALQISIAAAHVLLAATLLCWAALLVRERTRPEAPRFFLPLLLYAAWTLVATLFSFNFGVSLADDKQLLLFLIVPLVYQMARGERAPTVIDVVISVGAAGAVIGIIQYGVLHWDALDRRPQGTLTHYMTYSGVLMLAICAAVARLVFGQRDRMWPAIVMPALVVALALTSTRGAWVGASAGVASIFALKNVRLVALVPIVAVLAFAIAPQGITTRMVSMFDLSDPTIRDRVAMMRTGAAIISDQPLTGIGPDMVPRMYVEYRDALAVNATNPHLHNVPLQIAAERGLPAVAIWIWFVATLVVTTWRLFRSGADRVLAAGTLGAVAAMLAAGMFEYNFGDSEFLMLFLVLATLPFAATRAERAAGLHQHSHG